MKRIIFYIALIVLYSCGNCSSKNSQQHRLIEEISILDTNYLDMIDSVLNVSSCIKDIKSNEISIINYIDTNQMSISFLPHIYGFDDSEFYGAFYYKFADNKMLVLLKQSDVIPSIFSVKKQSKIDIYRYVADPNVIYQDRSIRAYIKILHNKMYLIKCF